MCAIGSLHRRTPAEGFRASMKACFKRLTGVRALLAAAVAFLIVAAAPASASIQFDGQWGSFSVLPTNGTFNTPNRAATDALGQRLRDRLGQQQGPEVQLDWYLSRASSAPSEPATASSWP